MIRKTWFFFLLISITVSAQQTMNVKSGPQFPATETWDFICERYAFSGTAKVQVGKTEKGGTLRLAVETTNPAFTISGTAYVFLIDNTIVKCSDKKMHDLKGNELITYYSFSPIEMARLRTTAIHSIHFNISGNPKGFSSQVGNFTALNRKTYFATVFDKSTKSYDTAAEISALYK